MSDQLPLGLNGLEQKEKLGKIKSKGHYTNLDSETTGEIISSWNDPFDLLASYANKEEIILREPQKGAIHAAIAHWVTSTEPANIIMPTGTGKTETMLSLLLIDRCDKLLVIVPTDPLRTQTFEKFVSLGIVPKLKGFNVNIKYPIVSKIDRIPTTKEDIDNIFDKSNVVIAIPTSLGQSDDKLLEYAVDKCSHLFIDEAHHAPAGKWLRIKELFKQKDKKVLQFTATPFRNDNQPIGGKTIFNYSLKAAFNAGYFKKIQFHEVIEWDEVKSDEAIAKSAIEVLEKDTSSPNNFDHLLLARTETIAKAEELIKVYAKLGSKYNPMLIHSEMSKEEKRIALDSIKNRTSRIIVCVDMFGEGFDLPNLKIAALHDIHQSLPITLQFIGRFTRSSSLTKIGDAHVIANIALAKVKPSLEQLYSQDPDWNEILQYKSDAKIRKQIGLEEFIESFKKGEKEDISLQNLRPKMSTVVYKMLEGTAWNPEVEKLIKVDKKKNIIKTAVSEKERVLVIVEGKRHYIDWGRFKDIDNLIWDLYLVYWNEAQNLLYINSSNNGSLHENLAKAVGGDKVTLFKGDKIFRSLHGLNRTIFQNVGLNSARGQAVRYTMYSGIDVEQGISDAQKSNKFKSNLFGIGFENGDKASIGCSYKGRIWSRKNGTISDFVEWCKQVGTKLLNNKINTDDIFKHALKRELIKEIPEMQPITIEWDQFIYDLLWDRNIELEIDGNKYNIDDVGFEIVPTETNDSIEFKITYESAETKYKLKIIPEEEDSVFIIEKVSGSNISIIADSGNTSLIEYWRERPPVIRFVDGSFLEGNVLARVREKALAFDKTKIIDWNWVSLGVDIKKESQGKDKSNDSIQYKVIESLQKEDYDIIFDDDGPGEIADILAIKVMDEKILVKLYHCKYSSEDTAGSRIRDLYEVCGQAQKSIQWKSLGYKIFEHLIRRANETKVNGFITGDFNKALEFRNKSRTTYAIDLQINIVQPGVSKLSISEDQLQLLGATETYLKETYQIPLKVISGN
jgi:superfamily II DNA or RNA helicase